MSLSDPLIVGAVSVLSLPVVVIVSLFWSDMLHRALKTVRPRPGEAVVLLAWINATIATYLAILYVYLAFN